MMRKNVLKCCIHWKNLSFLKVACLILMLTILGKTKKYNKNLKMIHVLNEVITYKFYKFYKGSEGYKIKT